MSQCSAVILLCLGGRFKKEVAVDGQSYLLLIRDEAGKPDIEVCVTAFLPRDAMHKHCLCHHVVSVCVCVCVSVCLSRSWILSKRMNISSNFFHHRVATPF